LVRSAIRESVAHVVREEGSVPAVPAYADVRRDRAIDTNDDADI
jgi:hypothetical protein